jgi:hypothetical protein
MYLYLSSLLCRTCLYRGLLLHYRLAMMSSAVDLFAISRPPAPPRLSATLTLGIIGYIRYSIFLVPSNAALFTTHSITSYTMLPRYSKQYSPEDVERDADSHPLLAESDKRTSSETAPPVYPPSSSSAINAPSGSCLASEGRHNVEYIYKPVFPREGDDQYAVGVLGKTKQVSHNELEYRGSRWWH